MVLRPTHHPFIDRETVVNYGQAKKVAVDVLTERLEDNIAEAHDPFSDNVLEMIQRGILESKRTPREIKQYCRRMLG